MEIFLEWRGDECSVGRPEDLFSGVNTDISRLLTVAISDIVGNMVEDSEFETTVKISLR